MSIDNCALTPCQNAGNCADKVNGYSYKCPVGFDGDNCEENINECEKKPCLNNGICYQNPMGAGYFCSCSPGFIGYECEIDINECDLGNYCCGDNTCVDEVNGYTCNCPSGYKGIDCCSKVTWCGNNSTCSNHGVCADIVDKRTNEAVDFRCTCNVGYFGRRCELGGNCREPIAKATKGEKGDGDGSSIGIGASAIVCFTLIALIILAAIFFRIKGKKMVYTNDSRVSCREQMESEHTDNGILMVDNPSTINIGFKNSGIDMDN